MKSLRGQVVYSYTHRVYGFVRRGMFKNCVYVYHHSSYTPCLWHISDIRLATEKETWKAKLEEL
jgi:hypothetical protein